MTTWRYSINYGPDGEENFANVYAADGQFVGNLRTHHAISICNAFAVIHLDEAMAALREKEERVKALEEVLEWYGEQSRLARLIHREGDAGRHAIAADGGKRARSVLSSVQPVSGSREQRGNEEG